MAFKRSKTSRQKTRRFKILLFGEPGAGKTYAAIQGPDPLVVDMEQGTVHYEEDFDFVFERTQDPDKVYEIVSNIAANPNIPIEDSDELFKTKSLVLDPIHIWELATDQKVIARRRKEERNPDYTLQPQDYKSIKIEKKKLMLKLMNVDLNVIVCARTKDIYAQGKFMEKIGIGPDCDDQWIGYFDTILYLYVDKITKKRMAIVYKKDRTNKLPKDAAGNFIPFEWSFQNLAKYLKDLNFTEESSVERTKENEEQMMGRHFETMFRDKPVKTAGVNGETLEKIAAIMSDPNTKEKFNNLLVQTAEITSPYDLTQDMADFLVGEITKHTTETTNNESN